MSTPPQIAIRPVSVACCERGFRVLYRPLVTGHEFPRCAYVDGATAQGLIYPGRPVRVALEGDRIVEVRDARP
jgi:hypothetical protein